MINYNNLIIIQIHYEITYALTIEVISVYKYFIFHILLLTRKSVKKSRLVRGGGHAHAIDPYSHLESAIF